MYFGDACDACQIWCGRRVVQTRVSEPLPRVIALFSAWGIDAKRRLATLLFLVVLYGWNLKNGLV